MNRRRGLLDGFLASHKSGSSGRGEEEPAPDKIIPVLLSLLVMLKTRLLLVRRLVNKTLLSSFSLACSLRGGINSAA